MVVSVVLMMAYYLFGALLLQNETLTKEKRFLGHVMILLGSCFLLWNLSELLQLNAIFQIGTIFFWIVLIGTMVRGYALQNKN